MLLTTRAGVAPVADAFLRGAPSIPSSKAGRAITMRWEQLESLVQDGGLGRYLATSAGPRSGKGGLPKPPSLTLPDWLVDERKRGAGARFDLQSPFEPSGDQPEAIEALVRGLEGGKRYQSLLGATGTVSRARSGRGGSPSRCVPWHFHVLRMILYWYVRSCAHVLGTEYWYLSERIAYYLVDRPVLGITLRYFVVHNKKYSFGSTAPKPFA